jgi:hypothetical protein
MNSLQLLITLNGRLREEVHACESLALEPETDEIREFSQSLAEQTLGD